jgi:hypothetical protein
MSAYSALSFTQNAILPLMTSSAISTCDRKKFSNHSKSMSMPKIIFSTGLRSADSSLLWMFVLTVCCLWLVFAGASAEAKVAALKKAAYALLPKGKE